MPNRIHCVALVVASIHVAAGCGGTRTDLGRTGDQAPMADAAASGARPDAAAPVVTTPPNGTAGTSVDGGTGGISGSGGVSGTGGTGFMPGAPITCKNLDAVFTDAAPPPMDMGLPTPPSCMVGGCPADGGCPQFSWPVVQTCAVPIGEEITVGCGVVSVETVQYNKALFQELYDDRTGAWLGSRAVPIDSTSGTCSVTPAGQGLFDAMWGDRWQTVCPSSISCRVCSIPGQMKAGYTCTCPDGSQTMWVPHKRN